VNISSRGKVQNASSKIIEEEKVYLLSMSLKAFLASDHGFLDFELPTHAKTRG
jgi:hypothetical protein